jgi:predicted DNA-binding protein
MADRKVATTIYITVEQDRQLKLLSEVSGTAMAQFIREGIDLVLERYADRLPRQLGLEIGEDS